MSLKVIAHENDPQLWKVLVTAKYANTQVDFALGSDPSSKDVLAKSPMGRVPVLETEKGCIFEANSIVRHIARMSKGNLYGSNEIEASMIDNYLDFANDMELPASVWIFPILGMIENKPKATSQAQTDIKKALDFLNNQLVTRTFLVGERITIADIVVAMTLFHLFQKVLDATTRKACPNVVRWFTTIVNQANVKAIVGEFTLCAKAEVAPATFTPKKPVEEKKEAPKKAATKEVKKEVKPDDDEEEESFEDEAPKKANPLDALPKSSMVFDEWKRTYSNAKDTKGTAMPWLWQNYDQNGYSMWRCDYKYNDENTQVFKTCNLVGGWIQRLDRLRKYGFGSLIIFGDEPKLEISGIWIFRGPDVPAEMTATDDYEQYDWKKLDVSDKATQELVGDYFAWDGSFEGRKFNQAKIFK